MGVEDRIEELYALPPEEFVGARDELANELKGEGDRDGAAQVKGLRRPTVGAWAVDQVAGAHPAEIEELLAAGRDLREGQQRALAAKGRTDVHELVANRRAIIGRLTQRARDTLEGAGRGSGSHLDDIADTFLAASIEPDVAELVRAGRLDRERKPSSDIADLFGLTQEGSGDDDDSPIRSASGDPVQQRAALESAERDAKRARGDADRASKRAEQAKEAARAAQEQADRRSAAADEAEREAKEARKQADAAERALDRLRSRRD
ncbi:MAG: hypothetical protein ABR600_03075 [Actinomycetota bacterium]